MPGKNVGAGVIKVGASVVMDYILPKPGDASDIVGGKGVLSDGDSGERGVAHCGDCQVFERR